MRIALLIDTWFPELGGGQVNAWELSSRIAREKGFEIDIFTRNLGDDNLGEQIKFIDRLNVIKLNPKANLFNWWIRVIWLFKVGWVVSRAHRRKPYEMIHAQANAAILPGKVLSWCLGVPLVVTIHGMQLTETQPFSIMGISERLLLTAIPAQWAIAVQFHYRDFKNWHQRVDVIPNGIDLEQFEKIRVKKGSVFSFVYVGRLHPVKNIAGWIEAIVLLKNLQDKPFKVLIVGDGSERKKLEIKCHALGLDEVSFMGALHNEEKIKVLKSADVFVLPSLAEGQPIVGMEAAAAGLPIIATKVGDNEYYVDEECGWLVPAGDTNRLARAMAAAMSIKNEQLRIMGKKHFEKSAKPYSWEKAADKTADIYRAVVGRNPRAGEA